MDIMEPIFCVEKKSHKIYNEKRSNNSLERFIWKRPKHQDSRFFFLGYTQGNHRQTGLRRPILP
ncbi:hypothetical protein, partial [Streptococcus pneumoniae]|uniref:hypothetical protein n=1 Tax=Streptococcus pneumoniae TaxID=1313 RepID=UPI001CD234E8